MKKTLILVLFLLSSCALREERFIPLREIPLGNIEGIVTNGEERLPSVYVWIYDKYGELACIARTDENGKYITSPIPEGEYYLCMHSGENQGSTLYYETQFYRDAENFIEAMPVQIIPGKTLSGVDFLLKKGECIKGKVFDESGCPIIKDSITIRVYDAYKRYSYSVYNITTDSAGTYCIEGIKEGRYRIYLSAKGHVGIFYGAAYNWDEADIIYIPAYFTLDFYLLKGATISGYVKGEGEGLNGVGVYLQGAGIYTQTETTRDGYYSISGIPDGEYILYVWPKKESKYSFEYYKDTIYKKDATKIVIRGNEAIDGIDFELKKAGKIITTFSSKYTIPIQGYIGIKIYTDDWERTPILWGTRGGNLEIPNLHPGKYILYAQHRGMIEDGKSFVFSYYKDAKKIENATPVTVKSGLATRGVNFILNEGGCIEGFVYLNGEPLSSDTIQTHIILYDTQGSVILTGNTNFNGGYKLEGIPEGEYKIAFISLNLSIPVIYYRGGIHFTDTLSESIRVNKGDRTEITIDLTAYGGKNINGSIYDKYGHDIKKTGKIGIYDKTGHLVQLCFVDKGKYNIGGLPDDFYYIAAFGFEGYKECWHEDVCTRVKTNPQDSYYFTSPPKSAKMVTPKDKVDFYLELDTRF